MSDFFFRDRRFFASNYARLSRFARNMVDLPGSRSKWVPDWFKKVLSVPPRPRPSVVSLKVKKHAYAHFRDIGPP